MTSRISVRFSGKLLEKHRKAKDMSRWKLSIAIDHVVGPWAIQDYERHGVVPNVDVVLRLAAALDVKPGDLTE